MASTKNYSIKTDLISHGIVIANGTDSIKTLNVAESGQVLTGFSGDDPVFSSTPNLYSVDATSLSTIELIFDNIDLTYQKFSIFRSPDYVNHGMTDIIETDAFGFLSMHTTNGSLWIQGLSDSDCHGVWIQGTNGSATPSQPGIIIGSTKKNGTTDQAFGADEKAIGFYTYLLSIGYVTGNGTWNLPIVSTDTISEKSSGVGVTIDGVNLKDGGITTTGAIELGNASDTTIARSAAGVVTIEGKPISTVETTNPKSMSQGLDLIASASVGGIANATNTVYKNTTNSFMFGIHAELPSWTTATILRSCLASNEGYQLEVVGTTGAFKVTLDTTVYTSSIPGGGAASNLVAGSDHKILAVVTVGTTTTVSFYLDGYLLNTTDAQANVDITNTNIYYTGGLVTTRYAMRAYDTYDYNYAPTAASILDLYRNGIKFADKWGSQTELVTGDNSTFASDTGWWVKEACWSIGAGVATCNGTGSMYHNYLTIGKRYRVTFTITDRTSGSVGLPYTDSPIYRNAVGTYTQEFVASGVALLFYGTPFVGSIDDVTCVEIGATLALESEGIQPVSANSQWLDSSTNALNATLPAAGASAVRKIDDGRYRWTTAMTDDTTWTSILPAGFELERIILNNSTANTCTLRLGTSAGGTEMISSISVAASTFTTATCNKVVSLTADTTLYLSDTGAGWGSCSLTATLYFRRYN